MSFFVTRGIVITEMRCCCFGCGMATLGCFSCSCSCDAGEGGEEDLRELIPRVSLYVCPVSGLGLQ